MEDSDQGYQEWTKDDLVQETVSNIGSLEGVHSVEWVTHSPYDTLHELIRVKLRNGSIIRLLISYCDEEDAEDFDASFHPALGS